MLRITTALFLLTPVIASAQCLTADALATGITIEYGSGSTSYIQRTDHGTIMDAYYSEYGTVYLQETTDGVLESRRDSHTDNTWESYNDSGFSYDFATDGTQPYTPGERGHGTLTTSNPDRGPSDGAFGWSVYPSSPLVVGDCSYEAVRVFTTEFMANRGTGYVREIKYLPALGFGVQVANSYIGLPASNNNIVSMSQTH